MWQDPTDVTKRKPRRLRGTPANRFTNILAFSIVGTFCFIANWYGTTDAEWVQRARKRVWERIKPQEHEAVRRQMFRDSLYAGAVNILNEKDGDMRDAYFADNDED